MKTDNPGHYKLWTGSAYMGVPRLYSEYSTPMLFKGTLGELITLWLIITAIRKSFWIWMNPLHISVVPFFSPKVPVCIIQMKSVDFWSLPLLGTTVNEWLDLKLLAWYLNEKFSSLLSTKTKILVSVCVCVCLERELSVSHILER